MKAYQNLELEHTVSSVTETKAYRVRKAAGGRHPSALRVEGVELKEVVEWDADELDQLQIDETYQRHEIKSWVNSLISVLDSGGSIPDPISVVERPDGNYFIVDGQQRYWAHWNCERPITAQVFVFKKWTWEDERAFFLVLNHQNRLPTGHVIREWPGVAGDLIRWMANNPDSPLCGEVSFTPGGRFGASQVVQAVYAAGVGSRLGGKVDRLMGRLDREIERAPKRLDKIAKMIATVIKGAIPDGERMRTRRMEVRK